MARKCKDEVHYFDGVKVTLCAYRGPRKGEKTYDISKSRYTAWHTGVVKYEKGSSGILGTVEKNAGFGVQ